MLDNGRKHFKEGLFGIFQRELSAYIYPEKSGLKVHGLLYAHRFSSKEYSVPRERPRRTSELAEGATRTQIDSRCHI